MKTAHPFDVIIFDWDDTLVDTAVPFKKAMCHTCRDLNLPEPSFEQLQGLRGMPIEQIIKDLFARERVSTLRRINQLFRHYLSCYYAAPAELFEHSQLILEELVASGYWLAIATGKQRKQLDEEIKRFSLDALFFATRCADETYQKPNPTMLQEILDDLGKEAKQCLMVGDSAVDMEMAAAIEMPFLMLLNGRRVDEDCKLLASTRHIDTISLLPRWLTMHNQS